MIEKLFYARNDGYLVTDVEKRQGNFIFYYPPSKKIVIYDVWYKKDVLQLAYNKRKNCNANIHPSIAAEVMEVIAKLVGIDEFPRGELSVSTKETAGVASEVSQPTSDIKVESKVALSRDIKNLGV